MYRTAHTVVGFAAFLIFAGAQAATEVPDGQMPAVVTPEDALYRCATVVTGTRMETRLPGFAECLREVVIKLTGDQTIVTDPRFSRRAKHPEEDVDLFSYRDRLFGRPVHDEQGTHDRPHNLTVVFKRSRIDALARSLGREPWPASRPRVFLLVAVENLKASFVLTRAGTIDRSADMREAITAATNKAALPEVVLPTQDELAARGWNNDSISQASLADAEALGRADGADAAIVGHMVFSEKALGWIVRWRMAHSGNVYRWGTRGVNFDAAYRNALFGAAQVLAGRGAQK
jgi:uncharacterized protein